MLLWVHSLPYQVLICVILRTWLFSATDVSPIVREPDLWFHTVCIVFGVTLGIAWAIVAATSVGLVIGLAFGVAGGISVAVVAGIGVGAAIIVPVGSAVGLSSNITFDAAFGVAYGAAMGLAVGIAIGIAGGVLGSVFVEILAGIVFGFVLWSAFGVAGIAGGMAFVVAVLRVYYHVFHAAFIWPVARSRWYRFHPVAWDDLCLIPFPGLRRLLVACAESGLWSDNSEIERLIEYRTQRMQALSAKATLVARQAGRLEDLAQLDEVLAQLLEGDKDFLSQTTRLRELGHEVSAIQTRLNTMDRPFLRELQAQLLIKAVESFRHQVSGFREPLATEFRATALQWQENAAWQLQAVQRIVQREPTAQVFRAGDPIEREREAFVPRTAVFEELERQVLLATGCPGIVLYGRRRMGKSTVLRNLEGYLPPSVSIVGLSMQKPQAYTSTSSLINTLAELLDERGLVPMEARHDLRGLYDLLESANTTLARDDRRLLLAIDEYETIDVKVGDRTFPEDLLAALRESIQSHRQLIWVFAGSHEVTELRNAPWTSYLVSARTVEVPCFTLDETRLLLTDPLRSSPLWRSDDPGRPRFGPAVWGDGGIRRIYDETAGWPHLVQLVAGTVVDLLNDSGISEADDALLARALAKAVGHGHHVFYELLARESRLDGEWSYLKGFQTADLLPPPTDEAVLRSLRHRQLIDIVGDSVGLRVPLMQRWLRDRG